MLHVTVVGAGIAGLAASLRLLERGISVTLLEQDDFLGGKLGSHRHGPGEHDYHEHSYHMYLNWYANFWRIVDEAGLAGNFAPQHAIPYLRPRTGAEAQQAVRLLDVGAPATALHNLLSGLRRPADMFLYSYSLIDLLATPAWAGRLERLSVLGFMAGRGYNTGAAISIQQDVLAKAFASPSWLTSARSYQRFIGFGFRAPSPSMWLMRGNTAQFLFEPLRAHMESVAARTGARLDLHTLRRVKALRLDDAGVVRALDVETLASSPTVDRAKKVEVLGRTDMKVEGPLILAIPHKSLASLVSEAVYAKAPALADVRRLQSQPMASLDLYFNKKLPNVPAGIVNLIGSEHGLSFLDLSQTWTLAHLPHTVLNVIASDLVPIATYDDATITQIMIDGLHRYVDFSDTDIEHARTHLNTNVGEALFTNQVGSWDLRPETECAIPNLFLAGDFCRNPIDVVTIEAAVVSGLLAAEAARKRLGAGTRIDIVLPAAPPRATMTAMKLMGEPYAYAAKAYSVAEGWALGALREMFPGQGRW
jgi:predicted NAD/FAD-dependent oxidoreductase